MLFKLLKLFVLLEVLLKSGPPNLGILCTDYDDTSMCDLLGYATCLFKLLNLVFLLEVLLKTGPQNLGISCTDYDYTSMCDLLECATYC